MAHHFGPVINRSAQRAAAQQDTAWQQQVSEPSLFDGQSQVEQRGSQVQAKQRQFARPSTEYRQAGQVVPVPVESAYEVSDKVYDKGARRGGAWRVVFFLSLFVLVGALVALGYIAYTYWNGQNEYTQIENEAFAVDDSQGVATLASFDVDWDALRAINPDVVGWVYLPDTVISYPICWRENDDNYYLYHNFNSNTSNGFGAEYGCIMLAGVNSPDWTDEVNIVYGHHLLNGSMFAFLADFGDHGGNSELFNQHRTFYVLTPEGNFRMTSFAVDKIHGSSTDIVIPNFDYRSELTEYVQARMDESLVVPDPPAPPANTISQVFAFSTCSDPDDSYRIVTFCNVDEFLPAGSDVMLGNSLVDNENVESVEKDVEERLS